MLKVNVIIYAILCGFIQVQASYLSCFGMKLGESHPTLKAVKEATKKQIDEIKKYPDPYLGYHVAMGSLFAATIWTKTGRSLIKKLTVQRPTKGYSTVRQSLFHDLKDITSFFVHGGSGYVAYHTVLGLPALHYSCKKRGYDITQMSYPKISFSQQRDLFF